MALWGFGEVGEDGVFTALSGATFDLVVDSFPTLETYKDVWLYEWDIQEAFPTDQPMALTCMPM